MDMDIPSLPGVGTQPNLLASGATQPLTKIVNDGTLDSISTVDGVAVLGQLSQRSSILEYVGTNEALLALFKQLIANLQSNNSIAVLKALGALMSSSPSSEDIQQTYDAVVGALTVGNNDLTSLNGFNTSLNSILSSLNSDGGSILADYNSIVSSNVSGTLSAQQIALQNLVAQFQAGYPSSMTLAQFEAALNTILTTSQNASDGQINTYNDAASSFSSYNSSVLNYNAVVVSPPLTQSQYDNDKKAIDDFNAFNLEGGGLYPTLDAMPTATVGTDPLTPTQTSIPAGVYDNSVTWPDPNDYTFTTSGTTVNMTDLNQLLADFGVSIGQANSTDAAIQSTLSQFISTDFSGHQSILPDSPFPTYSLLDIPELVDFQSSVLSNALSNLVETATSLNQQFAQDQKFSSNLSQSPSAQDQQKIDKLVDQSIAAGNLISLGSVGGISVLNINGITNGTSLSNAFIIQQQTISKANSTTPDLSTQTTSFLQSISNDLQSVYGAASIFGTLFGFRDAEGFLGSLESLNSSLVGLNSVEIYQSILGLNQKEQLQQIAEKSFQNGSVEEVSSRANQAALPYAFASQAQAAVLGSQLVENPAQFAAFYLTGYGAAAIDAYIQNTGDRLDAIQQRSVNAQAILAEKLLKQDVAFLDVGTNQIAISNAFQSAAQQLESLGVSFTADQLASAQSAFLAGAKTPLTADQLQQLIFSSLESAKIDPAKVVANSIFLKFVQSELEYIVRTKNDFVQNRQLNQQQSQDYSDRFTKSLLGESFNNSIQFVLNSEAASRESFAEELANLTAYQVDNLQILDGIPKTVPGTDIMSNAVTAKNDTTPVPTEKRTAFIPV